MYLQSIATATPSHSFTQRECWEFVANSHAAARLKDRSLKLLKKILLNNNGILKRHFAINDLSRIFDCSSDELNAAFEREAPALAARALSDALDNADMLPTDLDAVLICTCTGYLCPGLTSHVAEKVGLRSDAYMNDSVGLGCGAAIPTMRAATHFLRAQPDATVACVAVEICSAAFYLDDEPGVLISACIFGDGAAATIWSGKSKDDLPRAFGFESLHQPEFRDLLRFETREGKLRNRLTRAVPTTAANAAKKLFEAKGEGSVSAILAHSGGKDVLDALRSALPGHNLQESAHVLEQFGNMSSPSVLFALENRLRERPTTVGGDLWLVSFGAGFSCHSCRIAQP